MNLPITVVMEEYNINCEFFFNDVLHNRKILFDKAFSCCKYGKVLYILQEELNELLQLSQDLQAVDRNYIKMISFLYTPTLLSLVEGIATLPTWQNVPSTIILDDLSKYCKRDSFQNACGVVALLINIAQSCSEILKSPCRLYICSAKEVLSAEKHNILKELYSKTSFYNLDS